MCSAQQRSETGLSVGLKDAYFHTLMLQGHRLFLRFAFKGRAFQFKQLLFGRSLAPRVFTGRGPPSGEWRLHPEVVATIWHQDGRAEDL